MRRLIFGILILTLLLIAGCLGEQAKSEVSECDAQKPCKEGYECAKLPETATPVCVLPEIFDSEKYKDCAVLESYPVQLKCPEVKPAVGEDQGATACEADPDCKTSGCNSEICGKEQMASICVYKPEFECYKLTNCKCINGGCGWEQNEEFLDCFASKRIP